MVIHLWPYYNNNYNTNLHLKNYLTFKLTIFWTILEIFYFSSSLANELARSDSVLFLTLDESNLAGYVSVLRNQAVKDAPGEQTGTCAPKEPTNSTRIL